MITELMFGDTGPRDDGATATSAWDAGGRAKRAVDRNIDGGVLALMLAGIALAMSHLIGDAVASLRDAGTSPATTEARPAAPNVLIAAARCALNIAAHPSMILE